MNALQIASLAEVLEDDEITAIKKLQSDKKFVTFLLIASLLFNLFMFWAWTDAVALSMKIVAEDIQELDQMGQQTILID